MNSDREGVRMPRQRCMYESVSNGVRINVRSEVIEDRTCPERGVYGFAYYVTIKNERHEDVKLLNRHWRVFSADRQIGDVKGEGVIGEQPELGTGDHFKYASWTSLDEPMGSMEGVFTFRSESGTFFDVIVPRFDMVYVDESLIH